MYLWQYMYILGRSCVTIEGTSVRGVGSEGSKGGETRLALLYWSAQMLNRTKPTDAEYVTFLPKYR